MSGDLETVLEASRDHAAVLLDSLTLWVSARFAAGEDEEEILGRFGRYLDGAGVMPTPVILVSDEVGLGIVPESSSVRRFRDVLGRVNQRAAAAAGEVHLCVAGIGIKVK